MDIVAPRVRRLVCASLRDRGYRIAEAGREDRTATAAVLEFPGPAGRGLARLRATRGQPLPPAVVVLCRAGSVESAVAGLKEGASDFVLSPFDCEELAIRLERALQVRELRRRLRAGGRRGGEPATPGAGPELRGESPAMTRVRNQIEQAAGGRATVLIRGETGTGKELVASAIHRASARAERPLVKVNCAALPDPLLESELFGHERGAFTGAEQRRIGRFEEAHSGTLFLDEIGDMQPRTQAKVLRALQEQEFERLGGTRPIRVDVRIIAATNQDLRDLIAHGRFREDLYFRLNVVPIELPPLRERRDDVPILAEHFLAEFNREQQRPKQGIAPEALGQLQRYSWPGNVRELRNALERAVLMGRGERVEACDLALQGPSVPESAAPESDEARVVRLPAQGIDLRDVERELILQALERCGWVQKEAARLLHMSRRKLNYRIRLLGITHAGWRRNRGTGGSGDLC